MDRIANATFYRKTLLLAIIIILYIILYIITIIHTSLNKP